MRKIPGGLESATNGAACFRRCLREKLLQNNQFLRLLCLWGWKAAALSLTLGIFSVLCGKCSEDAENADVKELCGSAPPHPVRCPAQTFQRLTSYANEQQEDKHQKT